MKRMGMVLGIKPERIADIALGVSLRAYAFERYKTKRKDGEEKAAAVKVTIAVAGVAAVEKAFAPRGAVASARGRRMAHRSSAATMRTGAVRRQDVLVRKASTLASRFLTCSLSSSTSCLLSTKPPRFS